MIVPVSGTFRIYLLQSGSKSIPRRSTSRPSILGLYDEIVYLGMWCVDSLDSSLEKLFRDLLTDHFHHLRRKILTGDDVMNHVAALVYLYLNRL